MLTINPQFITDSVGKKISAILPIKEFNFILDELDELEDIRLYDESKKDKEPAISKEAAIKLISKLRKTAKN